MTDVKNKGDVKSKGRVLINTSKGLFPLTALQDSAIKKQSKQVLSPRWDAQHGLITPPHSADMLLALYESNSTLYSCVNQVAQDVAGTGWNIQVKEGKKENKTELARINNFIKHSNNDDSFRTVLKNLLVDWGVIGWFGIEVVRDVRQQIVEIYRVPAHTLRVHKSKQKYCQVRVQNKVWFKKFGIEQNFSPATGEPGEFDLENRANELLFYKNFYPKSDYYGAPNFISAVGDVFGLIGVRDYNLAFFENYGVPSSIIILKGDWEEGADEKVRDYINDEIKGTDNAHRSLVVTQPKGCEFQYVPLTAETKEASFRLYKSDLKENILTAYSMPPERIGIRIVGKLGGNVAEEATKIYIQGVVEPLQTDLEEIINDKLLQSDDYEFKFNNIDFRDYDALVKQLGYEIEHGMITPNEARNELGLKPYPDGDRFYMLSGLAEIGEAEEDLGLIEQEDDEQEGEQEGEEEQ